MAPSRAIAMSSSSASSRQANRGRATTDQEDQSETDDSYGQIKIGSSCAAPRSSSNAEHRSKRAHRDDVAPDEQPIRAVKKSTSHKHSSSSRLQNNQASDDDAPPALVLSDELFFERRAYDEWVDKKLSKLTSKREQLLQDQLQRIRSERDEIQSQYDELRQLRATAPEQALDEFKKTAEARYRHDKDLINSLKAKIDAAEKRAKEAQASGLAGADRSMSILNASVSESVQPDDARIQELQELHRKQMLEAQTKIQRLEQDVQSYKLQLEQEIAQSQTHTKSVKATSETSAASTSLAAIEDEKAVRKLYEDLTGLVITGVEKIDPSEPFRRFKAIFAQEDYYSVLMDLEESRSSLATTAGKKTTRDDIVYVPKIDDDRDSELLNSQLVPPEWLEALRFDRNMLFKWYEKTRKALITDVARLKLRAREERAHRR